MSSWILSCSRAPRSFSLPLGKKGLPPPVCWYTCAGCTKPSQAQCLAPTLQSGNEVHDKYNFLVHINSSQHNALRIILGNKIECSSIATGIDILKTADPTACVELLTIWQVQNRRCGGVVLLTHLGFCHHWWTLLLLLFLWLDQTACRMSVPWPGVKPWLCRWKPGILTYLATREIPAVGSSEMENNSWSTEKFNIY